MTLRKPGDHLRRAARRHSRLRLLATCGIAGAVLLTAFTGASGAGVTDYSNTLYFDGAQSGVASASFQILPVAGGAQPVAPGAGCSALTCATPGITGSFNYVYLKSDGSGHYATSLARAFSVTNAQPILTGLPAGADVYRQKTSTGIPVTPYQLIAAGVPAGSFTDTIADPVPGTPQALPDAFNRAAIGDTGYYDFAPTVAPPSSSPAVLDSSPSSTTTPAQPTSACRGWIVDAGGGLTFAAGTWTLQMRVKSGASNNGQAFLTAAIYRTDSSGVPIATVVPPTDSVAQIQNISGGSTIAVTATTASSTQLAANEHLCIRFWRHQTVAYTGGGLPRTVTLFGYEPNNQITVHPAPDALPSTPAVMSPSPADGSSVTAIPTLAAQYADQAPGATNGTVTFRLCGTSTCGAPSQTFTSSPAVASATTVTWTPSTLADGTWWWQAQATDGAGGTSDWSTARSFRLDTSIPSTPTLVSPADGARTNVSTLTAQFTDPDNTDTGYLDFRVCSDVLCATAPAAQGSTASPVSSGANGSWLISPALSDNNYWWEARARDVAGNTSGWSSPARALTLDTTAPDTSFGSTKPASATTSTSATFDFSSTESGSTFACSLDSGPFNSCTSPDTRPVVEGQHTFEVRATDTAGNTDPSPASYTWTVDVTPPDTTIGPTQPSAVSISANATFDLGANEPSTFECKLDGALTWQSCATPKTYTGLADGSHTFSTRATDLAGNVDATPATSAWSIDTSVPAIPSLLSPEDIVYVNPAPQLQGRFVDPDPSDSGTVEFRLCSASAAATVACSAVVQTGSSAVVSSSASGTYTPVGLGDGTYHWQARAVDAAGNASAWTATRSFVLDTLTPDVPVLQVPDEGAWVRSVELHALFREPAFTGTGNVDFRVCTDAACLAVATSGSSGTQANGTVAEWSSPQPVADGSYWWVSRARDAAGNTSDWSAPRRLNLDATPPGAPTHFNGVVAGDGLTLRWDPPADTMGNFIVYVNGELWQSLGEKTYEVKVGPFDAGDQRTFSVEAVDKAGNHGPRSPVLVGVPNVVGLTLAEAENAASSRGLVLTRNPAAQRIGTVIVVDQNPEPASLVRQGSPVKVSVKVVAGAQSPLTLSVTPKGVACGPGSSIRLTVRLSRSAAVTARFLDRRGRSVAKRRLGVLPAGNTKIRLKLAAGTRRVVVEASADGRRVHAVVRSTSLRRCKA